MTKTHLQMPPQRPPRGFTLIEVLVTVIILAIGLLGLAGLQLSGLRATHTAYHTSQATIAADEIIDRMRANRDVAEAGGYDLALEIEPPPASCLGATVGCDPETLAAADLREWRQGLSMHLPLGLGAVERQSNGVRVVVQWDDSRGEDEPRQLIVETAL